MAAGKTRAVAGAARGHARDLRPRDPRRSLELVATTSTSTSGPTSPVAKTTRTHPTSSASAPTWPAPSWWMRNLKKHPRIAAPKGRRFDLYYFEQFCDREMTDADVAAYHAMFPRTDGPDRRRVLQPLLLRRLDAAAAQARRARREAADDPARPGRRSTSAASATGAASGCAGTSGASAATPSTWPRRSTAAASAPSSTR